MATAQGFPVNNKQEIEELVYNTLNATVHLEDGAGNHITWSFANGDDALDLFDCGPEHTHDQGFVMSNGVYVDRKTAAQIAMESGQVKRLIAPPNLYSEDLWSGADVLPSAETIRALTGAHVDDGVGLGPTSTLGNSGMKQS